MLGQSGPKSEASNTVELSVEFPAELNEVTATGGMKRRWPVGGCAKGMPRYADTSGRTREAAPLTVPALTVTGWPTVHDVCRGLVFGAPATGDVSPNPAKAARRRKRKGLAAGMVM